MGRHYVCSAAGRETNRAMRDRHLEFIREPNTRPARYVPRRGLALSRDSNMTLLSPTVMGWLGYAYAVSGRGAESLSLLREAVAGIESMGMGAFHALRCVQLGEVAHCHLGLGKLSRRSGDGAKAQEHVSTAMKMYREMDMRSWQGQAEAEMVATR